MKEHDGDHRIDEIGLHFEELVVCLESIIVLVQIVVNMGISDVQLCALFLAQHVLVPKEALG